MLCSVRAAMPVYGHYMVLHSVCVIDITVYCCSLVLPVLLHAALAVFSCLLDAAAMKNQSRRAYVELLE